MLDVLLETIELLFFLLPRRILRPGPVAKIGGGGLGASWLNHFGHPVQSVVFGRCQENSNRFRENTQRDTQVLRMSSVANTKRKGVRLSLVSDPGQMSETVGRANSMCRADAPTQPD